VNKPLVTVIVPAYNHENYIEACLKSVVEQTYDNMQIIVFNDGSTDRTGFVIEQFIKTHEIEIEYISKENEGLCKTLNKGLAMSKGQYIAIIASDDIWLPNKIEEQVSLLEKNRNLGLVCTDAYFLRGEIETKVRYSDYKTKLKRYFKNSVQNTNIYEALLVENFILAVTVMTRKECFNIVGVFDESLKYEDYDMWLRISSNYPIGFIDTPLAYYRTHENNISNNTGLMLRGALQSISKQFEKNNSLEKKPIKKIVLLFRFFLNVSRNRIAKIIIMNNNKKD